MRPAVSAEALAAYAEPAPLVFVNLGHQLCADGLREFRPSSLRARLFVQATSALDTQSEAIVQKEPWIMKCHACQFWRAT